MDAFKVSFTVVGTTPYSQSRPYERGVPKKERETADAYENRTWKERLHVQDGQVIMPILSLKMALAEYAKYIGETIPGKGKATWTKHYEAGILPTTTPMLYHANKKRHPPITPDDVKGEWLYLNADGKRGGSTRVWRCMTHIDNWAANVEWLIVDRTINMKKLEEHLRGAGLIIGVGRWRPRNAGTYGRFNIENFEWEEGDVGDLAA